MKEQVEIDTIVRFLQDTFRKTGLSRAVIAVSGGIDSSVSLTLLSRALSGQMITPVLLPYGQQTIEDARTICAFNKIPENNVQEVNIQSTVDHICRTVSLSQTDVIRRGNVMARVRMTVLYDWAKKKKALVVGTENKSEHYLGYFTRFGDAASDVEPIIHLYKTQVQQTAIALGIPEYIITKHPSAGLWKNQTDEEELGFTYEQADKVLEQLIDHDMSFEKISIAGIPQTIVKRICSRVQSQHFKHEVPYQLHKTRRLIWY